MQWIMQPWPWYIAGPLIGLMVPLLLLLTGKSFGVSTSLQHINAMCAPKSSLPYLKNYNWRQNQWRLIFIVGIIAGAVIASQWLSAEPVQFLPTMYNSWGGTAALIIGGLLVGFGARYADGCTSGHTIMGLSNLQWPSLVASVAFFAGGLLMVWVIMPILF